MEDFREKEIRDFRLPEDKKGFRKIWIAILMLFLLTGSSLYMIFDPPSAYTKYYGLRMWDLDANPSADSLNQNWIDTDSLINDLVVFTDSLQLIIENDTLKFAPGFVQSILDTGILVVPDSVTAVKFQPVDGSTIPYQEGLVFYDKNAKAFTVYDDIANTSLELGQEFVVRVVNNDADTLKDGDVCSYAGWNGKYAYAVHANAKTDTLSTILAVATHDIAPGDSGKLTVFGAVRGINTSAYSNGDILYVDTLDGKWTNVKPPAKFNQSPFGFILRSDATEGIIYAYTGLIPAVDVSTGAAYISNGATAVSTNTTPVPVTNVTNDLFTIDEDVTHNITISGDTLFVNEAGIYKVKASYSFTGSVNVTYRFLFFVNGTENTMYQKIRKVSSADVGYTSVEGRFALSSGDYIIPYVAADGVSTFTPVWSILTIDELR